jgi:hypothetical protein
MTRGFGWRIHPRHVRSIHSTQNDDRGSQQQRPQYSSQASGQQQNYPWPPAPRGRGARQGQILGLGHLGRGPGRIPKTFYTCSRYFGQKTLTAFCRSLSCVQRPSEPPAARNESRAILPCRLACFLQSCVQRPASSFLPARLQSCVYHSVLPCVRQPVLCASGCQAPAARGRVRRAPCRAALLPAACRSPWPLHAAAAQEAPLAPGPCVSPSRSSASTQQSVRAVLFFSFFFY